MKEIKVNTTGNWISLMLCEDSRCSEARQAYMALSEINLVRCVFKGIDTETFMAEVFGSFSKGEK